MDPLLSAVRSRRVVLFGCIALSLCMIGAACNDAWFHGLRLIPFAQTLCGVAAVMLLPRFPTFGATALVVSAMAADWLPFRPMTYASHLLAIGVALIVLGYRRAPIGFAAALAMPVNRLLFLWTTAGIAPFHADRAMLDLMGYATDIGDHLVFVVTGLLLARMVREARDQERMRRLRDREMVADQLHDRICNELSLVVMRIDDHLACAAGDDVSGCTERDGSENGGTEAGETPDAVLGGLRGELMDTLTHTRATIAALRRFPAGTEPSDAGVPQPERDGLIRDAVALWRRRLDDAGVHGEIILPGTDLPELDDDRFRLLRGLIDKLFGDIGKYADPASAYMVAFGWSADRITVSATDAPRTGAADTADGRTADPTTGRSGLDRYAVAVRRLDGTWSIGRSAGEWSLHCALPVRDPSVMHY